MKGKPQDDAASGAVRLDKWLWAARFFKTRSLAGDAIDGGHVQVNGDRGKPARALKLGDMVQVRTPGGRFEVRILALSDKRGPASVAQAMYEETPESAAARARAREDMALAPVLDHPDAIGRPTKKLRRQLQQFRRGQQD
ncbi:MAG: RNA-binding S4 domain-containing protein [Burkholderiales bacterium]|nr:RNA-binding S4 domain-containing protein [Burkholderiales bacterium]